MQDALKHNLAANFSAAQRKPGEPADSQLTGRNSPWYPVLPASATLMSIQNIWSTKNWQSSMVSVNTSEAPFLQNKHF